MESEERKPIKGMDEEFAELEEELREEDEAREKARKRTRGPYRKASVRGRTKLD